MYRSKYNFEAAKDRHETLPTIESTVQKHFEAPVPDASIEIPYAIRNQHIYVPGKTRHGKSTLFHAMALQDIANGAGVCVIDPKGDLVNSLINHIPESRKDDCVYLSVTHPVPIDFMDYDPEEKETLVGEIKYVITRGMAAEQAPLMDAILTDLCYTILNANENPKMPVAKRATFLDIHRFLSDVDRRNYILSFVTDGELKHRWETNFPNPKECAPAITRMTPFMRNPSLRRLFDCPDPSLKISEMMDNRKILLVNLGGISESTKILATLLIGKIRQAAFRRAAIPESDRIPFFLYVDEFEFFQTSDFDQILSFAGGYGLRLTLANQFIGQLDSNIRQSIFGNVGSFIVFCVSSDDAKYFKEYADGIANLPHLPKFMALYSIAGQQSVLKSTPAPPPAPQPPHIATAQYIRKRTLEFYSCNTPQVLHTSVDGTHEPPDPQPTDDPREAGGASTSQPVLRPSEQGRGQAHPKKGTQQKRYPHDQPKP